MIVPDIFVSCFAHLDGVEPGCRGLVSQSKQLTRDKYIWPRTVFANSEPVNSKSVVRGHDKIKVEGRRPGGMCEMDWRRSMGEFPASSCPSRMIA